MPSADLWGYNKLWPFLSGYVKKERYDSMPLLNFKKAFGMRKIKYKLLVFVILVGTTVSSNAQKLSDKQDAGIRAPLGIKVDGKIADWNSGLKAYNKTTQIYYSLCNDDDNLYLVVQAADPVIIRKINSNSLSFMLKNPAQSKKVTVTFPLLPSDAKRSLLTDFFMVLPKDSIITRKRSDSLIADINRQLTDKAKEIGIAGIPSTTDNTISVYNELGIKAAAQSDNRRTYTLEFAIPLKYVNASTDQPTKLNYTIILNGLPPDPNVRIENSGGYTRMYGGGNSRPGIVIQSTPEAMAQLAANDPSEFSGDYVLAKKQ